MSIYDTQQKLSNQLLSQSTPNQKFRQVNSLQRPLYGNRPDLQPGHTPGRQQTFSQPQNQESSYFPGALREYPRLKETDAMPARRETLSKSGIGGAKPSLLKKDTSIVFGNFSKKRGLAEATNFEFDPQHPTSPRPKPFNLFGQPDVTANEFNMSRSVYRPAATIHASKEDFTPIFNTMTEYQRPSEFVNPRAGPVRKDPINDQSAEDLELMRGRIVEMIKNGNDSRNDFPQMISEQSAKHRAKARTEAVNLPTAISTPFSYVPSQSIEMPRHILDFIGRTQHNREPKLGVIYELSQVNKVAFIAVDKTLFVWDYTKQSMPIPSSQMHHSRVPHSDLPNLGEITIEYHITAVKELTTKNMSSSLSKFLVQDSIVLMVATTVDVRLIVVSRGDHHHLKVQESSTKAVLISTDPSVRVNAVAEFAKTGRVFLGLSNGQVLDIVFENQENTWLGGTKKQMKIQDLSQSWAIRVIKSQIPASWTTTKVIKTLEIDEQRNLLYALCEQTNGRDRGRSIILVYDLGLFGDKMNLAIQFNQHELVTKLFEFQGRSGHAVTDFMERFDLAGLIPIRYSESSSVQLKVMTKLGEQIFISFQLVERSNDVNAQQQQEKLGLQNDYLIQSVPSQAEWQVTSFISLPEVHRIEDSRLLQSIAENPLKEHVIPSSRFVSQSMIQKFAYDHHYSTLIAQVDEQEVIILERNSKPAKLQRDNEDCLMNVQMLHFNSTQQETIQSIRAFKPMASSEILATLGYLPAVKDNSAWGKRNPLLEYSPTGPFENHTFFTNTITLLTEQRLIELYQVRPIDNLYNLLNELARSSGLSQPLLASFDDFVQSYTPREVCAMLVQILTDKDQSFFIVRRVEEMYRLKSRLFIQQQDQARNINLDRSALGSRVNRGQQAWQGSIWNVNRSHSPINRAGQLNEGITPGDILEKLCIFDPQDSNEVTRTHPTTEVRARAWELLMRIGDTTIKTDQRLEVTCRSNALVLYLSRLLRPIWNLPIVSRPSNKSLKGIKSNIDLFVPLDAKIEALQSFILDNKAHLYGFTNQQLQDDQLGSNEKEQLKGLLLCIERCQDIFQFLNWVNDEDLSKLCQPQNLSKDNQDKFGQFTFSDMISPDANEVVQAVIMAIIKIRTVESGGQAAQFLEKHHRQIEQDLRTFYMTGSNRTHLGKTLLDRAMVEGDDNSKNQLLQKAISVLIESPEKVNLDEVIPQLVRQGIISGIVHLCLLKAQKIKDEKQIEEIYSIVEALIWALHRAIEGGDSDEVKKDEEVVRSDREYKMFYFFFKDKVPAQLEQIFSSIIEVTRMFKNQTILPYVFKGLLIRGTSSNQLAQSLTKEQLVTSINALFEEKKRIGHLTVGQFAQMERLLLKANEFFHLAKLTLEIVSDQTKLRQDRQPGQTGDLQPFTMTCQERYKKVKDILTYLQSKESKSKLAVKPVDHDRVITDLKACHDQLIAQDQVTERAKSKLALIDKMPAAAKNQVSAQGRKIETERAALQTFISQSDQQIFGIQDLNAKGQMMKLYDWILDHILNKMKPQPGQEPYYKKIVQSNMNAYVNDLVQLCGHNQEQFYERLTQDVAFFRQADTQQKQIECLIRLVRDKYPLAETSLDQLPRDPLSRLMMLECGMKGSQLILHEHEHMGKRVDKEREHIRNVLAIFREWLELVEVNPTQKNDFMDQGKPLIQQILRQELSKLLKGAELKLKKDESPQLHKLLEEVTNATQAKYEKYWPSAGPSKMSTLAEQPQASQLFKSTKKPNLAARRDQDTSSRMRNRSFSPQSDIVNGYFENHQSEMVPQNNGQQRSLTDMINDDEI